MRARGSDGAEFSEMVLDVDSTEGCGLETHVTQVINVPLMSILNVAIHFVILSMLCITH